MPSTTDQSVKKPLPQTTKNKEKQPKQSPNPTTSTTTTTSKAPNTATKVTEDLSQPDDEEEEEDLEPTTSTYNDTSPYDDDTNRKDRFERPYRTVGEAYQAALDAGTGKYDRMKREADDAYGVYGSDRNRCEQEPQMGTEEYERSLARDLGREMDDDY